MLGGEGGRESISRAESDLGFPRENRGQEGESKQSVGRQTLFYVGLYAGNDLKLKFGGSGAN